MGHIAEPKNVDLIIESHPLSDQERNEISEFIEKLKKNAPSALSQKKRKNRSRVVKS